MADILLNLSYKTWESVFDGNGVNRVSNSFFSTFCRIFYSSFLKIQVDNVRNKNSWITLGIIISCKHKREYVWNQEIVKTLP